MKNVITITWVLLLMFTGYVTGFGQDLSESEQSMSIGANNALTLDLPMYDDKFVDKHWKDYLKDFKGRAKKVKRSDELFSDDAEISYMSNNTVDIYSLVKKSGDGSELTVWFDLGGAFLNSDDHPEAYEGALTFFDGFQKLLNVENIKVELDDEEKNLKDLERELTKLEKLNEKYHKQIEDWKSKIAENEQLIDQNILDQEGAQRAIDDQKEVIRSVEVKLANAEN